VKTSPAKFSHKTETWLQQLPLGEKAALSGALRSEPVAADLARVRERGLGVCAVAGLPRVRQLRGEVGHRAGGAEGVEVGELGGEDEILQHGLPEEGQVRLPVRALLVVRRPGRIEEVDDEVGLILFVIYYCLLVLLWFLLLL